MLSLPDRQEFSAGEGASGGGVSPNQFRSLEFMEARSALANAMLYIGGSHGVHDVVNRVSDALQFFREPLAATLRHLNKVLELNEACGPKKMCPEHESMVNYWCATIKGFSAAVEIRELTGATPGIQHEADWGKLRTLLELHKGLLVRTAERMNHFRPERFALRDGVV